MSDFGAGGLIPRCNCVQCQMMRAFSEAMAQEIDRKMCQDMFENECEETLKQAKEILDEKT